MTELLDTFSPEDQVKVLKAEVVNLKRQLADLKRDLTAPYQELKQLSTQLQLTVQQHIFHVPVYRFIVEIPETRFVLQNIPVSVVLKEELIDQLVTSFERHLTDAIFNQFPNDHSCS